jgi:hypothetical protein
MLFWLGNRQEIPKCEFLTPNNTPKPAKKPYTRIVDTSQFKPVDFQKKGTDSDLQTPQRARLSRTYGTVRFRIAHPHHV